jgi:hypothetical protein
MAATVGVTSRTRALVAALALAALLPGCVSRKLFLLSQPPGATVWLDGVQVGVTPYEEQLPAAGTRRLELLLPGHETLRTDLVLPRPWWDTWPLDMLAAAWPWTLESHHAFEFALAPAAPPEDSWGAAERALRHAREAAPRLEDG